MEKPILIAGGGIGGLTAAIALSRRGLPAQVLERAPELKPVGAGIVLAINALQVLERIGVLERIAPVGEPLEAVDLFTPNGKRVSTLPLGELARELGVAARAFHRADLHLALVGCLAPDVVRLGAKVTGFDDHGDGVRVALEHGEVLEGSLLVGADGLHSIVRKVLGDDAPPDYAGQTTWRGVTRTLPDLPLRGAFETWGGALRFGAVRLTGDRAYWFAVETAPAGGEDLRPGLVDRLREKFRGWHAPIDALFGATDEDAIVRTDLFDRKPTRSWGRGRVTLLGDAAHPMAPNLGQGASQAMEDAAVLAELLATAAEPVDALRQYEAIRQKRTRPIVLESRRAGAVAHWQNPVARWLRDRLIATVPTRIFLRQARRLLLPTR